MSDSDQSTSGCAKLCDLQDHPRQYELFPIPLEAEINELARDIDENGQRNPVVITQDGVIVCGNLCVQAAAQLGWDEIYVETLPETQRASSGATVVELISDYVMNGGSDVMTLLRCEKTLRRAGPSATTGYGAVLSRIRRKLYDGESERSCERKRRLLDLPREFHDLVTHGRLKFSHVETILRHEGDVREEIYEALRSEEEPKAVLRRLVPPTQKQTKPLAELARKFVQSIEPDFELSSQNAGKLAELARSDARFRNSLRVACDFLRDCDQRVSTDATNANEQFCSSDPTI